MIFRTIAAAVLAAGSMVSSASAASVFESTPTDPGGFDLVAAPGSSFPADHTIYVGDTFSAAGEGIAISGVESFSIMLASGGKMINFGFQMFEPTSTQILKGCNTACVDSSFFFEFFDGALSVASTIVDPAHDVVLTYTISPLSPFDKIVVTETGSNDNEFFANFRADLAPVPLPAGGALLLGGLALLAMRRKL